MIINASIDIKKVDMEKLKSFKRRDGTEAKFLDIALIENRDGQDQYGNDGMVVQSTTKEERAAGKRGPILGNYKITGVRTEAPESPEVEEPQDGDVPF